MSIPKVIHFCWFGGHEYPEKMKECMKSWEKYCPDFEIKKWDESNFDVNQIPYIKEAYEHQRWAFVSDYARLKIIYEYGGIYMDTDVELLKPLTELMEWKGFMGFQNGQIATGLGLAAEPGNDFVRAMMENYNGLHFIKRNGREDKTPCPDRDSSVLAAMGVVLNGQYQILDDVHFLPEEYLNPMDWKTRKLTITENTIAIHHFAASWYTEFERSKWDVRRKNSPIKANCIIGGMYLKKWKNDLLVKFKRKTIS